MEKVYQSFKDELLNSCVPFWLENGADKEYGGLLNCLDRTGRVYSQDKSVWMQGRAGWMFSYIYNNIEQKQEYLDFAKSCIDFATKYCIDSADGRMYFSVTHDGQPLLKRRYWFSETFYIMANAEYYMATKDASYLARAKKYFDFVYGALENRGEKHEVLNAIFDDGKAKKETTVLIGDTFYDMRGAQRVGIDAIGVTYGFGKREDLVGYNPVNICNTTDEIKKLF